VIDFNEEDCTPHWGKFVDKVQRFTDTFLKSLMISLRQGCLAKGSKTRVGTRKDLETQHHALKFVSSVSNLVCGTLNAGKIGEQCVRLPLRTFRV
jgi:hypothetical protein